MENNVSANFKKIKKATISEAIINQIKEMIAKGIIKPGQRLPSERELAETLEVGRPAVREAMRSLAFMGIVEVRSGEGTYLADKTNLMSDYFKMKSLLSKYTILELIESRKILELEAVSLAAERATPENKEALQEAYQETLRTRDDKENFLKADFAFHLAIADATQNSFLAEMLNTVRDMLIESNYEILKKPGQIDTAIKYHGNILNAIMRGNKEEARQQMLLHLENVEEAINELFA